jgi:hypothetical protein
MSKQLTTGAGVTVGATLLMGGAAQAATLTVGTTADTSGATDCAVATNTDCTLRDAINDANSDPGSTITFRSGLSGTITLGSSLPAVLQAATISGPGAGQLTVDANGVSNVLAIVLGANAPVTISGLTITGGDAGDIKYGGGIYSDNATLTLKDMVVTGNQTSDIAGGGVGVVGGSLTMENSTVSGNIAGGSNFGGGVYLQSGSGAEATIRSSTISGNEGGFGGGIYFDYSTSATLENSTVYDNTSSNEGGGVYHFGAPGGPGLTVTGSTITHNRAIRGGGIASDGDPNNGQPVLRNTIVFGNTADTADDGNDLSAEDGSMDAGFSLIGSIDPDTTLNQTGPNLLGQDPQLGPLANNGGPTQTQKPALASPVIDQGLAFGLGSDQRPLGRPVEIPTIPNAAGGDGSDIGAVEVQPSELPSNSFTAKVKGKKILVTVSAAGSVGVADGQAPLSASEAKKKKKAFLKASSGSGGAPAITVPLRLTKFAKQKLRQKGKLAVGARITFTPNRGIPRTQKVKLKIKGKKRK